MKRFAASVTVEYEEPQPSPVRRVTINMTPEAAAALHAVLRNVGGNSTTTARGLVQPITDALDKAGIEPFGGRLYNDSITGQIYFKR